MINIHHTKSTQLEQINTLFKATQWYSIRFKVFMSGVFVIGFYATNLRIIRYRTNFRSYYEFKILIYHRCNIWIVFRMTSFEVRKRKLNLQFI
jgi:hypothetical protein